MNSKNNQRMKKFKFFENVSKINDLKEYFQMQNNLD